MDPRLSDLSGLGRRPLALWRERGWWGRTPLWERVRQVAASEHGKLAIIDGERFISYGSLWREALRQSGG